MSVKAIRNEILREWLNEHAGLIEDKWWVQLSANIASDLETAFGKDFAEIPVDNMRKWLDSQEPLQTLQYWRECDIAEKIENYMYERGEYDNNGGSLPPPLKPLFNIFDHDVTVENIANYIQDGGAKTLYDYVQGTIGLWNDYRLNEKGKEIITELKEYWDKDLALETDKDKTVERD